MAFGISRIACANIWRITLTSRNPIQGSIIRQEALPEQPFTRFSAYTFLLVGYALSLGIGLYIGWHMQDFFGDVTLLFRDRVIAVHSSIILDLIFILRLQC